MFDNVAKTKEVATTRSRAFFFFHAKPKYMTKKMAFKGGAYGVSAKPTKWCCTAHRTALLALILMVLLLLPKISIFSLLFQALMEC